MPASGIFLKFRWRSESGRRTPGVVGPRSNVCFEESHALCFISVENFFFQSDHKSKNLKRNSEIPLCCRLGTRQVHVAGSRYGAVDRGPVRKARGRDGGARSARVRLPTERRLRVPRLGRCVGVSVTCRYSVFIFPLINSVHF